MIVKAVPRGESGPQIQALYMDAGDAHIRTGHWWFDHEPSDDDLMEIPGGVGPSTSLLEIRSAGPGAEPVGKQYLVRFAVWATPNEHGTLLRRVVTTGGSLYILSDKGDTVDRVL